MVLLDAAKSVLTWAQQNPALAWPVASALVVALFKPRTAEQYAAMAARSPKAFWSRFAALLQLTGAMGVDLPKALAATKKVMTGKSDGGDSAPKGDPKDPPATPPVLPLVSMFFTLLSVGATIVILDACGLTGQQAHNAASLGCALLEAETDSKAIDSICATAPELAAIAADVLASRGDASADSSDGGARKAGKCKQIPDSKVCALDSELSPAIKRAMARRQDGGGLDSGRESGK